MGMEEGWILCDEGVFQFILYFPPLLEVSGGGALVLYVL
jgi:hypothetical protein